MTATPTYRLANTIGPSTRAKAVKVSLPFSGCSVSALASRSSSRPIVSLA